MGVPFVLSLLGPAPIKICFDDLFLSALLLKNPKNLTENRYPKKTAITITMNLTLAKKKKMKSRAVTAFRIFCNGIRVLRHTRCVRSTVESWLVEYLRFTIARKRPK